jgi:RHS repeat-associated protein
MAGISSTRLPNNVPNRKKYNGIEETSELDLNQYEAFYRTLDPQIGRFWQIDPETYNLENESPFISMGNNPINNEDPLGDFRTPFGAWLNRLFHGGGKIGRTNSGEYYVLRSSVDANGNLTVSASFGSSKRERDNYIRQQAANMVNQWFVEEDLIRFGIYDRNLNLDEARRNFAGLFSDFTLTSSYKKIAILANFPKSLSYLFRNERLAKVSELMEYAISKGWKYIRNSNGPIKYIDENGKIRMTIKKGSLRTPGSEQPHVSFQNSEGKYIDIDGNVISRTSPSNHTPINYDIE